MGRISAQLIELDQQAFFDISTKNPRWVKLLKAPQYSDQLVLLQRIIRLPYAVRRGCEAKKNWKIEVLIPDW